MKGRRFVSSIDGFDGALGFPSVAPLLAVGGPDGFSIMGSPARAVGDGIELIPAKVGTYIICGLTSL